MATWLETTHCHLHQFPKKLTLSHKSSPPQHINISRYFTDIEEKLGIGQKMGVSVIV
jgi:hypothetical protein